MHVHAHPINYSLSAFIRFHPRPIPKGPPVNTLTRLLKLVAPFRWWVLLAVLLSFATVGSSVGLMAMSAYLISKAALTSEQADLALAITGVRFFALARAAFRYAERFISHTATFRILTHLRTWFYTAVEPLAPARLQQFRGGDLLARIMADIETLENFYIRVLVPPLAAALVTLFATLILGSFNIWLGLALLGFLLLTGLLLPLVTRWLSRQPAAQSVSTRAELNATLVDTVQGIADLLSFGQDRQYQARAARLSHKLNQLQERLAMIRGLSSGLTTLFTSLAALTVLWLAIPLVTGGQIDGVFLALLPLTAIASFEAVQPLSHSLQYLESGQAAGKRLFELIDAPPAVTDPVRESPRPSTSSIELCDVRFRYAPGEPLALDKLSFHLPSGGRLALVGPSGSGKTTVLNLLLRFWDYGEGQIRLGGYELRDYHAGDSRRMMAVVSQHTHLFNSTIRDNLYLANPDASEADLDRACRIAQIYPFIQDLALGYDTLIGENGLLLSGGERQRLAIARAILKDAPILILDEATANLDSVTERKLWAALDDYMNGRTALIISHRTAVLPPVDQIIQL
jgi:ATP-binding cassette subfamily C protein CydC